MRILVLNCGSSSVKAALIETSNRQRLFELRVENIGSAECRMHVSSKVQDLPANTDVHTAVQRLLTELDAHEPQYGRPEAIAHRIVHGGAKFTQPTRLDEPALAAISELNSLAPLHNPPALEAARIVRERYPDVPHVAVFDTAFHTTLPTRARQYALPLELSQRLGIRRYGFHGTSHAHVAHSVARYLRTEPQSLRIISCHLGNGASITAIEYGRSVETSMGMTPLEGLVMGSRCGDIDPGVLLHLLDSGEYDAQKLQHLLTHGSGLKGLTGTNDLREIEQSAGQGDEAARLALTLYSHRARKYIGAYAAVMGGVDAIAFTGGIGENSALMRHRITQRLDFLGARIDDDRNRDARVSITEPICDISEETSRVRLIVVRADEEMAISTEAAALLCGASNPTNERITIPVAISARHAHLSQPTIEALFGKNYQLHSRTALSQPGQFSARETVNLVGPRGRIDAVRLMGPARGDDQVEISRTDEFTLGIDAPVRVSGDLNNTPGITLEGPAGRITIKSGVIVARRHIHMTPEDAQRFGLRDHDSVSVRIDSEGRDLVFDDVMVRVSASFKLEMHLDTDEANAAGLERGDNGELTGYSQAQATIGERRLTGRSWIADRG